MSNMKPISSYVNNRMVTFSALSLVIHAVLLLPMIAPAPPRLSPPAQPDNQALVVSFTKPAKAQSTVAAVIKQSGQHHSRLVKSTPPPLQPKNNDPATPPSTKQSIQWSEDFAGSLRSAEQSPAQELAVQLTQPLHIQQPHNSQLPESAHRVTQQLNLAISEHFTYPRLAQRNGWQGLVKLGLRIEPNGQLSRIRVISTSGYAVLDQAAMETLNRISVLRDIDAWLRGRPLDTVLPIEYKLLGG